MQQGLNWTNLGARDKTWLLAISGHPSSSAYPCIIYSIALGHTDQRLWRSTLQRNFLGIARPQSQFLHSCICQRFIYSQDLSTYFPAAELADRSWKYINLSQIYECRILETEQYNSVLEITVSFMVIHIWEVGNQTFILDCHRPFICSVTSTLCVLAYLPNSVKCHLSMNIDIVAEAYTTQPDKETASRVLYVYLACLAG